ncbi:hormogonium polysaccharide biosynthesis protein HpsA [Nodularia spumigena]|uniref:Hormogonium polysaccharide biosynthesis protein HpsA n=1 Tax=Nodularia spumigena UHCC 0060 TaxID=3110300 RepID=A0ABU5UVK9_NODSP|nr:hormogonium polysaccharide biosynthesis protein HpsA [Nodularia spumigena]MEA5527732.1 hormogonium polysaccharide biosynthesis protein HpsA [Nodularia spumigena UHCC 0143]MEA5558402.1 hormogonium polysaccharide biosynthesis protein HpsA [Nodularia spumigena CH309]MEA5610348.1 hormogonium polysaccharide biosynthesis protein HpsA [Nodularia spumigena UHCC 0060]MEA5612815.1 hormogonium polysaccharide biosynthesis protein HpsA [Nodularia spumigena UHCC 0040]
MSRKRRLVKTIKKNFPQFSRNFISAIKKKLVWLLRTLFLTKKRTTSANAGFVLPTVAMVSVVVVVLTTAILFRSFDRAQNASNVRVNSSVLSAATPAIDRGRAKLNKLFQDTTLPRSTPTDDELYDALTKDNKLNEYTFGDETPIRLTDPGDSNNTLDTAWRFPVDSDNNGKFDSYTLYGIYFKTPPVNSNNKYERARNTLEARTSPMQKGTDASCDAGALIGDTGWIKQNNEFKKSFFVYTSTVPITDIPSTNAANYEKYTGNKSFAGVEYQQDRVQGQPNNHAIVYEDDLELNPSSNFNKLNGGIFTNSNILDTDVNGGQIKLYQVSTKDSCFYEARNAKITVGGNLALGGFTSASHDTTNVPQIDLFQGNTTNPNTTSLQKSVNSSPSQTAYNNLAYENRIQLLVNAQMGNGVASDPSEVTEGIAQRKVDLGLPTGYTGDDAKLRREQLEFYFKRRTRRVPYAEVALNGTDTPPSPLLEGSGDTLRPNGKWIYPTVPTDGKTGAGYTTLALNINGASLQPQATEPKELKKQGGKEALLGDRILAGNNLPELWWDEDKERFVGSGVDATQNISGVTWNLPNGTNETRTRRATAKTFADNIAFTDRDGQWEVDAAKVPQSIQYPVGGLRVVTGAGIYLPKNGTTGSSIIWPDTDPVPQAGPQQPQNHPSYIVPTEIETDASGDPIKDVNDNEIISIRPYELFLPDVKFTWRSILKGADRPYLQMRATAVYDYTQSTPIACVSSFYVPTNSTTAQNKATFAGKTIPGGVANGLSNNGIVYGPPTGAAYNTELTYQSQLTYPDPNDPTPNAPTLPGRLIDDGLLAKALAKTAANRTLSEQSAIDAQICALEILNGSISPDSTVIPHGAIREIAFLDPREVKQNSLPGSAAQTYDMPIRDRQPLEIRATVIDLSVLRPKIPNSGLIYATRDDALPDDSAGGDKSVIPYQLDPSRSPVDYILDPTRRPNGIMLENGQTLYRTLNYEEGEKGLILATNLPAYVKGNFNLHTQGEELDTTLAADWGNFYSRTGVNENFACRNGDPTKPTCTSDEWRPATVLADAVTLLSDNFRAGYRDEGDYDWNNSWGSPVQPGFSEYNSFAPLGTWRAIDPATNLPTDSPRDFDPTMTGFQASSYVNNFVTPLVLWTRAPVLYVEVCLPDTTTAADDCVWTLTTANSGKPVGSEYKIDQPETSVKTGSLDNPAFLDPLSVFYGNPHRVAYVRDADGNLLLDANGNLQVYGVQDNSPSQDKTQIFSVTDTFPYSSTQTLKLSEDKLIPWLSVSLDVDGTTLLYKPVLQIEKPFATATDPTNTSKIGGANSSNPDTKRWLQQAGADTTFNIIVAAGDSPASPTEDNGGLQNLVRFMENWQPAANTTRTAIVNGAFMQVKKSAYATSPYNGAPNPGYAIDIDSSTNSSGFLPPARDWRYDVGLLSQEPDLFAQNLALTPPDVPDEYFREVGRNDPWVKTLLCATETDGTTPAAPGACN